MTAVLTENGMKERFIPSVLFPVMVGLIEVNRERYTLSSLTPVMADRAEVG